MAKKQRTKKQPPAVDVGALARHVHLQSLHLRKSECALIAIPDSAPEIKQAITIKAGRNEHEPSAITVSAMFTLDGQDTMHIEATFEILYRCNAPSEITPQQMETLGHTIGVQNAWPYWREFVQTMTSRMGLPSLTLPLVLLQTPTRPVKPKTKGKTRSKKRDPAKK